MNRSMKRWTTAFAAAALLALPAAGWSQATGTPPASQQSPAGHEHQGTPQEHLRKAKTALDDVQTASVPASAKSKLTELKRHVSALEKAAGGASAASKPSTPEKSTWSTHVAEIDKILAEMIGPAGPATTPSQGATGTTGSRAGDTAGIDETTKSKLMEVRTHITAFAASMSGGGATPGATEPAADPAAAAAAAAATQPSSQQPPASSSSSPSSPSSPATPDPSSTAPTTGSTQPPSTQAPATQPPTTGAEPAQQSTPAPSANAEEAKQHLTAARNSLSELTQLPAAAQLTGDARTQVSQLITNFNELITTQSEWRASYDKVEANVNALLGPETASGDPAQAQAQPPTGTTGAVGTTGVTAVNLDPAIKAKLVEFRAHLDKFQKAAGDGAPAPPASPDAAPAASAAPASAPTTSAPSTAEPGTMDQESAMRHIEAIEAIVSGGAAPSSSEAGAAAGTAGTPAGAAAASGITLDRTKVEQIRMHLAELRKAIQH